MNLEDIKVGDVYNVRVRVVDVDDDTGEITTETANENGYALGFEWCYYAPGEALAFSPITAENGIKNTEPVPKYDTCRRFKKGDIVEPVERWGRKLRIKAGQYRIEKDEEDNRVIITHCETGFSYAAIDAVYLKLVTMVEELEPYSVEEPAAYVCFRIKKGGKTLYSIPYGEKEKDVFQTRNEAKEAAEAECKRLNAEYRKEQQ